MNIHGIISSSYRLRKDEAAEIMGLVSFCEKTNVSRDNTAAKT